MTSRRSSEVRTVRYRVSLYSTAGVETIAQDIPTRDEAIEIQRAMYADLDPSDYTDFVVEEYEVRQRR